jgi:hypothetical protein
MVVTHFDGFQKGVKEIAETTMIFRHMPPGYKTGSYARAVLQGKLIPQPYSRLNADYDWIVSDADFAYVHEDWESVKTPTAIIIEDDAPDGNTKMQMEWARKNKVDVVFHRYKRLLKHYSGFNFQYLPHSIDIDFFKDYGLWKKYDVLMVGWHFESHYPYRHRAYELLKDKPYFTEIERPGESPVGKEHENKDKWPIGLDYAKVLNKAKICVTGGLIYDRPVMKYLETAAAKSLIVSNWFDELGDLGFKDGENMVVADYENLDKQMRYLLENDRWKPIAERGYEMVRKRHNTTVRAKEMVECLKSIKTKN